MTDALLDSAGVSGSQLAELLDLVAGTEICELDVTVGTTRLSLHRPAHPAQGAPSPAVQVPSEPRSLAITSPLVGIFHASVSTGDNLQPGQSIGAVEALGMPTSVDVPQSGTVEELLVADGSPVEYGQPLLVLHRTAPATLGDG
ncbi:MAG: biotin/lipoyl-binding protein [Chloroflexi bacterium]|nr:biotin/lipoyl-binding protein [Chloroflexota bacterium]